MPHDAARLDETRSWLNKASKDLRAVAHDLQAAPPLLEDVDFHCHQAAEKVLKGFLVCGGNGDDGTFGTDRTQPEYKGSREVTEGRPHPRKHGDPRPL